jgi:glycosyltransferase involved in cell wall biosynthesis
MTGWHLSGGRMRDVFPLISCVMVTAGRVEHVKRSVACYLQQTYAPRDLVILSQGGENENAAIQVFLDQVGRKDILFFPASPCLSLGALRNLACEIATGELVCQWDDDDLYHPVRMMTQYRAIISESRGVASAYSAFLKCFADSGEVYWCNWYGEGRPLSRLLPGSVMFYKKYFYEAGSKLYPEVGPQCHVEEDLNVLGKLFAYGKVVPILDGLHYLYIYHGNNTYHLAHHRLAILTTSGKLVMSVEELLQNRLVLENTLQVMGLTQPLKVRSLEGDAFIWHPKGQE